MKRVIPIGLIAVGISIISGTLAWSYFNGRISQPTAVSLPDSIAGLQITSYTTGTQAVAEFTDLHGREFPITSGAIGIYGNHDITVWAAGVPSEAVASAMTNAMQGKIAEGNSPFSPLTELNDNNRKVYVLEGMGQKHFYFQSKNLVIWLAANPALAEAAIQQILEAFP